MNDSYINSIQRLLKEKKYSPLQKNSFKKSMKDYQLYNKELKIQKTARNLFQSAQVTIVFLQLTILTVS